MEKENYFNINQYSINNALIVDFNRKRDNIHLAYISIDGCFAGFEKNLKECYNLVKYINDNIFEVSIFDLYKDKINTNLKSLEDFIIKVKDHYKENYDDFIKKYGKIDELVMPDRDFYNLYYSKYHKEKKESPEIKKKKSEKKNKSRDDNTELYKFLYPISDSGYLFEYVIRKIIKDKMDGKSKLTIRFCLKNRYDSNFEIPIDTSQEAYMDCTINDNFDDDKSKRISSSSVVDLKMNNKLRSNSPVHHTEFDANEDKEFVMNFRSTKTDFKTIDLEYFMKPEDGDYGLYRLRFDFKKNKFTERFCLKKYKKKFINP